MKSNVLREDQGEKESKEENAVDKTTDVSSSDIAELEKLATITLKEDSNDNTVKSPSKKVETPVQSPAKTEANVEQKSTVDT